MLCPIDPEKSAFILFSFCRSKEKALQNFIKAIENLHSVAVKNAKNNVKFVRKSNLAVSWEKKILLKIIFTLLVYNWIHLYWPAGTRSRHEINLQYASVSSSVEATHHEWKASTETREEISVWRTTSFHQYGRGYSHITDEFLRRITYCCRWNNSLHANSGGINLRYEALLSRVLRYCEYYLFWKVK